MEKIGKFPTTSKWVKFSLLPGNCFKRQFRCLNKQNVFFFFFFSFSSWDFRLLLLFQVRPFGYLNSFDDTRKKQQLHGRMSSRKKKIINGCLSFNSKKFNPIIFNNWLRKTLKLQINFVEFRDGKSISGISSLDLT